MSKAICLCASAPLDASTVDDLAALQNYGMQKVADVRITGGRFVITITDIAAAARERSIYAFIVGGKIQRIGSSKGVLRSRMLSWQRLVTARWQHPEGTSDTPQWEADGWRDCLESAGYGEVYARQGTQVQTPVGTFCAYLDEESILIGRHRPPLNRSMHR